MKRAPRRSRCVLLVEDDPLNLELLQAVLEGRGFTVLAAADARAGIELARARRPDVVLMDLQLPELDGLEATRILRRDPATASIPVIAVTAHVKKDDEEASRAAGCVLHLPKPVDTRSLPDLVARVIDAAAEAVNPLATPAAPHPERGPEPEAAQDGGPPAWLVGGSKEDEA